MIAYIISLLILGIPICWVEWTMGRKGGAAGFHSSPGIFHALIRHPFGKILGALGFVIPVAVYTYYVFIETWCAGYFYYFLTGKLNLGSDVSAYQSFWSNFVGNGQDGISTDPAPMLIILVAVFILNYAIIFRGVTGGIEAFCKWAMPALIVMGLIMVIRVLTLGTPNPEAPDQNVMNGLKHMWAPGDVWVQLRNPEMWLAAAGQILFSLSVGFGVIITYASYLHRNDDVVGSGLTAAGVNEFCEVGLGGFISVPAAFIFLGATGVAGQATFQLGFNVLPLVFTQMPLPWLFGGLFFLLLFFAAITSSISMLQPGIAYLEEGFGLRRGPAVSVLAAITMIGTLIVVYFSRDLKALDTIDFWVGTFGIFVMAGILVIWFGWNGHFKANWEEMHRGAAFNVPKIFKVVIRWIAPAYLLIIFVLWALFRCAGWNPAEGTFTPSGHFLELVGSSTVAPEPGAQMAVAFIAALFFGTIISVFFAARRWGEAGFATHSLNNNNETDIN
jgi:NSS family neurotransmitter:Na+ symporter